MPNTVTRSPLPESPGKTARSPLRRNVLAYALLALLLCAAAWPMRCAGGAYSWNGGGADNRWDTLANWVGATGYPNSLTDTATIVTNATPVNIDLNGNRSLLSLSIAPYGEAGFSITNSTLTLAAGGAITLDMTGARGPNNQAWTVTSAISLLGDGMINNRTAGGYGRNMTISGQITGSNTLWLAGATGVQPGYWGTSINGNNTNFTGTVVITNGPVAMNHVNAFGSNATPIQLRGGNLALNVTGGTKPITVTTNSSITALGNSTYTGNILLTNNPTVTLDSYNSGNSRTLGLSGAITGTGNLKVNSSGAVVTFSGASANTFTGSVTIIRDTLVLNKTPGRDAIPGNVTIGDGSAAQHILLLNNNNQINDAGVVGFACTSTNPTYACFRLNGYSETVGGLQSTTAGYGTVENASSSTASTLTVNTLTNCTFSGVVRDGGTKALNVAVGGSATQVFDGVATNSGTWTVNAGALGGTGTVAVAVLCTTNATTSGGALAPGDPAATNGIRALRVNGASLQGSTTASRAAQLVIQADNYDRYCQLVVTGAVNLNANSAAQPAMLVLNLSSNFTADVPGVFMKLIDNDGSDAISGMFQGIGELSSFQFTNAAHTVYTIEYTYKGGDGNDFGLVIANSPPPAPSNPTPTNNAVDVPPFVMLDWDDALGAHGYGMYLWKDGTTEPTTPTAATVLSQYKPLTDLDWQTTYHWQIVTSNRIAATTGPIWTFTTRPQQVPAVPVSPSPADGASNVLVGATLDWADSALVDQYKVFLWQTSGSKPATPTAVVTPSAYTPPTNLLYDTAYSWQVQATNTVGTITGAVWTFRTEKYLPTLLTATGPTNGATNMLAWMPLQWTGDVRASAYRVFVWHTSEPQPSTPTATVTNSPYFPYHYLDYGTNYYWQVVGSNSIGMTTNPIWTFRTDAQNQRVASPAFDISPSAQDQRAAIYTKAGRSVLSGAGTPLSTGTKIDFFGDSITWLNGYVSYIQTALNSGAGTAGHNITCINRGINGGGVLQIRDGSPDSGYPGSVPQAAFTNVIASDQANVAVVFIGINDVDWRGTTATVFEQALRDIVAEGNSAGVKVVLATPAVNGERPDGSNGVDPQIDQFAQITRNVATSTDKALVDLRTDYIDFLQNTNYVLNADGTISIPYNYGILTYDGIHPTTPLGNNMLADLISMGIYQGLRPPDAPTGPTPADGATYVPQNQVLSWGAVTPAGGYSVYLWPATGSKPGTPTSTVTTNTWTPPGGLSADTDYRWQVVVTNSIGSTTGAIWAFSTGDGRPVLPVSGFTHPGGVPTFDVPNTIPTSQYTLVFKNNLADAAWTALTGSGTAPGNGGTLRLSDPTAIGSLPAHRFYRIERNP